MQLEIARWDGRSAWAKGLLWGSRTQLVPQFITGIQGLQSPAESWCKALSSVLVVLTTVCFHSATQPCSLFVLGLQSQPLGH